VNRLSLDDSGGEHRAVALTNRDVRDARRSLGRLAQVPDWAPNPGSDANELISRAREILSNRQKRIPIFGAEMFGETGWDLLLVLYIADAGQRLSISRLARRSRAAQTTVLRWLNYLESRNWIRREGHPDDRRSMFVEITDEGRCALNSYLSGTFTNDK